MLFTSPWVEFSQTEIFKKLGLDFFKKALKVLDGHYYFIKEDHERLCRLVVTKIKKDRKWFDEFFSICEEKTKKMLSLENKDDLEIFIKEMVDFLGCSTLVEFTDLCIENYLKELCRKKGLDFSLITFNIRLPRKTELIKYKTELLKLKKNKDNIDNFVKRFKWVGTHSFEGKGLTKQKALEELKSLKQESSKEKRNIPKDFKKIIEIASELAYHRSNLMETVDRIAYSYWDKIKGFGKKHNLSFLEVVSLTHNEITDLIRKEIIPKNVSKRKKKFGFVFIDNKADILLGQKLKKELEIHNKNKEDYNIKEIKGTVAYPGIVRGKIGVVKEVEEIKKIKKGDILVAHETTPDFIRAMDKAVAFVTDIGGLTCHAAIMSREMKKPCIIATKIATKVLQDKDLVEVDANKGIVKILKNNS